MKRAFHAVRVAKGTLNNTWIALKRSITPQEDLPGIRRSFMIDYELWERIETDDIKYAFKWAWREYMVGWRYTLNRQTPEDIAYLEREEEERAIASLSDEERKALQQLGDDASALRKVAQDKLDAVKLRSHAISAADKLKEAAKDPSARARLASMASTGLVKAHEAVDSFLLGYYEGQAAEIEKERAAQAQRAAAAAAAAAEGGASGGAAGGAAAAGAAGGAGGGLGGDEGINPFSLLSEVMGQEKGQALEQGQGQGQPQAAGGGVGGAGAGTPVSAAAAAAGSPAAAVDGATGASTPPAAATAVGVTTAARPSDSAAGAPAAAAAPAGPASTTPPSSAGPTPQADSKADRGSTGDAVPAKPAP